MPKKYDGAEYKPGLYHPKYVERPTRCGGCGAEYVMPKDVDGSEINWMLADGWKIDAELMTIRCPACVAQAEHQARVLAS